MEQEGTEAAPVEPGHPCCVVTSYKTEQISWDLRGQ